MSKKMNKKLRTSAIILVAVVGILTGMARYYTELVWFDHLGFGSVFLRVLLTQVAMGVAFAIIAFLFFALHIMLIRRFSRPREVWVIPTAEGEVIDVRELVKKVSTPLVVAAAIVVAGVMGVWASRHWEEMLQLLNQTPFGQSEPILGQDIGFYLFSLPIMQFVQEWLAYLTGIGGVLSAVVYFMRGAVTFNGRWLEMSDRVRAHLLATLASVLLVTAWGWRLQMFESLFSKRGVAYGATYTDVYVNLVAYRILIAACVACAIYLVYLVFARHRGAKGTRYPAIALGGVVVLYLLGFYAAPWLVQQFVVNPNELDKERPYLRNAIDGTRAAYGLDRIESKEFPALDELTVQDLKHNRATVDNIKIWDHRPLKATYKQVQAIRLYYDFPSITVDRYYAHARSAGGSKTDADGCKGKGQGQRQCSDNDYYQVMLAPRELVIEQLPPQSQTWVNKHLQYTHGYGACLSPVKSVVGEGLPDLWIKDIPPQSRYSHMKITRPEIYHGIQTTEYALVKTNTQEFDYPKGSENKYTTYAGDGGVGIGSLFRRLLFAIRFADSNLLFTRYLTPESRILFYRTVQDRIGAVAPFLMLDQEPYMVVADGRLFWIQDAYTVSQRYPYSQPTPLGRRQRINYIRNSVKVVLDAYHGTLQFYIWDDRDPLVRTYAKMFPSLFRPGKEMPESLRVHVRYPRDLFTIQSVMYESFHMTDPQIYYNQEDKWAVSRELGEKTIGRQREQAEQTQQGFPTTRTTAKQVTSTNRMDPYYMIMRLPQKQREEFLLMVPFTPVNKDNMVAWMTASCDGQDYGKLLVYTFPKQKLVFGPMQIEARIDQDEYISQWITLRNQQGSIVIRGDLLVIPIKDAILYVEPIYLQSTQTQLPELKQIIVSFGKRLTMKETLTAALQEVFDIKDAQVAETLGGEGAPLAVKSPAGASDPVAAAGADGAPGAAGALSAPAVTSPKAVPGPPAAASPTTAATTAATRPLAARPGALALPGAGVDDLRVLLQQAVGHYQTAQEKIAAGDWAAYGGEQKALKQTLDRMAQALEGQLRP